MTDRGQIVSTIILFISFFLTALLYSNFIFVDKGHLKQDDDRLIMNSSIQNIDKKFFFKSYSTTEHIIVSLRFVFKFMHSLFNFNWSYYAGALYLAFSLVCGLVGLVIYHTTQSTLIALLFTVVFSSSQIGKLISEGFVHISMLLIVINSMILFYMTQNKKIVQNYKFFPIFILLGLFSSFLISPGIICLFPILLVIVHNILELSFDGNFTKTEFLKKLNFYKYPLITVFITVFVYFLFYKLGDYYFLNNQIMSKKINFSGDPSQLKVIDRTLNYMKYSLVGWLLPFKANDRELGLELDLGNIVNPHFGANVIFYLVFYIPLVFFSYRAFKKWRCWGLFFKTNKIFVRSIGLLLIGFAICFFSILGRRYLQFVHPRYSIYTFFYSACALGILWATLLKIVNDFRVTTLVVIFLIICAVSNVYEVRYEFIPLMKKIYAPI